MPRSCQLRESGHALLSRCFATNGDAALSFFQLVVRPVFRAKRQSSSASAGDLQVPAARTALAPYSKYSSRICVSPAQRIQGCNGGGPRRA